MGKTPTQRREAYVTKQERREEAIDLISKIAELQSKIPVKQDPQDAKKSINKEQTTDPSKKKKNKKKNKKKKKAESKSEESEILNDEQVEKDMSENIDKETKDDKTNAVADENEQKGEPRTSTFVDNRGSIKGFANITKVSKKKRSYTWKERLAEEERKRRKVAEDEYFESSSGEDNDENGDESLDAATAGEVYDSNNESSDKEEEEEEFAGFSDNDNQQTADFEDSRKSESDEDDEEDQSSDDDEDDEEDQSSDDDEDDEEELDVRKRLRTFNDKAASFMSWIEEQTEKSAPTPVLDIDYKPLERPEDKEVLSDEEEIKIYNDDKDLEKPAFYVNVERDPEIQEARSELPVFKEEHNIMEAIRHNDTVIICGETGSGKTTQLPQFLFEAGYGSQNSETPGIIGVTQPRRVAAMSMAERVSKEMGNYGEKVSYQIRFASNVKKDTKIKFMTDGVLLREMMTDFLLTKYSAIVIDEAHERNINTDILIGMLSRIVKLRAKKHQQDSTKHKKLKLIIMSATLRVSDFAENKNLFAVPPPILKVEARMYPVSVHFNKRTPYDYLNEAFRKTCKIHRKLPRGGILVFLTSQQEIMELVKKLRERFPIVNAKKIPQLKGYNQDTAIEMKVNSREVDVEDEEVDFNVNEQNKEDAEFAEDQDDYNENDDDNEEEEGFTEELEEGQTDEDPLYVLPLYSLLPTKEQMKVFEKPPGNARVCIVATNIAETSITIPNIRYVVDCGRSKQKVLSKNSVQSYEVSWISQASAEQRAGRAGRTGPGHTYRLFSSAIFDEFEKFSIPEILRMPIESVILQMKSIGIDNIVNFPFPTPVAPDSLYKAEQLLLHLGALNKDKVVTDLGKNMSLFPLSPRFAKMLLTGNQYDCLTYVITIVCALSVGDPFLSEIDLGINHSILNEDVNNEEDEELDDAAYNKKMATKEKMKLVLEKYTKAQVMFAGLDKYSDALKILCTVCAVDFYKDPAKRDKFLREHFIRPKVIEEIHKLRKQLLYIVKIHTSKENIGANIDYEKELKISRPPNKTQIFAIKQIITTGFIDQIAIRADLINADVKINKRSTVGSIPYCSVFPATNSFKDKDVDPFVYIHPRSILTNIGEKPPAYIVYQSLDLNSTGTRIRMRCLTDIEGKALTNLAKNTTLLSYSKPLGPPYGPELINPTKQKCYVIPRFGGVGSSTSWDLPPIRVIQNKVNGQWITK